MFLYIDDPNLFQMKKRLLFAICIFLLRPSIQAQDSFWTPEDIVFQEYVSEAIFSPDGKKMLWTKSRPDKKADKRLSEFWLTYTDKKDKNLNPLTVQLTRGDRSVSDPVFSPDGETLYYLSTEGEGKQLHALSLWGGAPYVVDSFKTELSQLKLLNDSTLLFVSEEGKTLYEQMLEEEKDDVEVVEDTVHFKPSRVFAYYLRSKRTQRLTPSRFPIQEYAVSKDGTWLVSAHERSPHYGVDGKPDPAYYLHNLKSGTVERILESGFQTPNTFNFTADNQGFYFVVTRSSTPEWKGEGIYLPYYYDLTGKKALPVPLNWDNGLGEGYRIAGNDLIASLANGPTNKQAFYQKKGNTWTRLDLDAAEMNEHVSFIALSEAGTQAAFAYSTASAPHRFYLGEIKLSSQNASLSKQSEFVKLNPALEKKPKPKTEILRWKGSFGDEISGILYYPMNYKPGRTYPLVTAIHGGPNGADLDAWDESWAYYALLMSQKGAFVLKPNYHGSSNHGQAFVESIKGHYYEYELPDIIAGINLLLERNMAHKDSLGVMGWSNGSLLAIMLIVQHPELFKVAGCGAGDVNWTSDYGTCEFGVTFDQYYLQGAPWDNRNGKTYNETYIVKSPLFEMEKVRTPTIIFHGSEDRAVPRDQSHEFYRALQQIGQAPVRFLWFPGQKHSLGKLTHQIRKIKEEIGWFDTYLYGKKDQEDDMVKDDSPLLALLEKEKSMKVGERYGQTFAKIFIPEVQTVKKDSIAIGRFEVTHAQYAAFNKAHVYPASQANYPVFGLDLKQAMAYCDWLSKNTGETWRLPNEKEALALHKLALKNASEENTLQYWAAYPLTRDEVPEFSEKTSELKSSLLKEVGSFALTEIGEANVYDIGGNVSEWDSAGNIYGYSAYDYADSKELQPARDKRYVGFRVIKELRK